MHTPGQRASDSNATKEYHFLDDFLQVMFLQHRDNQPQKAEADRSNRIDAAALAAYHALPQARLAANASYQLPESDAMAPVTIDSPAIEVMTDLRRVAAATISRYANVEEANQSMIAHGVRSLLVVDFQRNLLGLVTTTDVLGEKPVQLTQQRGIRHDEVLVRDIMTPTSALEAIDLQQVEAARVGDVLATLLRSARQHALVFFHVTDGPDVGRQVVRGIFSLTQIVRQLDVAYTS